MPSQRDRNRAPSHNIFTDGVHIRNFGKKLDIGHHDLAGRAKFDDTLPFKTADFAAHGFERQPEIVGKLGARERQLKMSGIVGNRLAAGIPRAFCYDQ